MNDHPIPSPGSGLGCQPEALLVLCDFDGTVCSVDMGNAFLERFAKPILHEKCMKNGTPSLLYDNFGDIHRCLEKNLPDGS